MESSDCYSWRIKEPDFLHLSDLFIWYLLIEGAFCKYQKQMRKHNFEQQSSSGHVMLLNFYCMLYKPIYIYYKILVIFYTVICSFLSSYAFITSRPNTIIVSIKSFCVSGVSRFNFFLYIKSTPLLNALYAIFCFSSTDLFLQVLCPVVLRFLLILLYL